VEQLLSAYGDAPPQTFSMGCHDWLLLCILCHQIELQIGLTHLVVDFGNVALTAVSYVCRQGSVALVKHAIRKKPSRSRVCQKLALQHRQRLSSQMYCPLASFWLTCGQMSVNRWVCGSQCYSVGTSCPVTVSNQMVETVPRCGHYCMSWMVCAAACQHSQSLTHKHQSSVQI